jgi:hypothetical protein
MGKKKKYLNNRGAKQDYVVGFRRAAQGLKFRCEDYRHIQATTPIKVEQLLKRRGILDDKFLKLSLACPTTFSTHTNASKANRIDCDATETGTVANQQAFQCRAPCNNALQRTLGDRDHFKRELLKLEELKPLDSVVREVASFNGGNNESFREAEKGFRQHW